MLGAEAGGGETGRNSARLSSGHLGLDEGLAEVLDKPSMGKEN